MMAPSGGMYLVISSLLPTTHRIYGVLMIINAYAAHRGVELQLDHLHFEKQKHGKSWDVYEHIIFIPGFHEVFRFEYVLTIVGKICN